MSTLSYAVPNHWFDDAWCPYTKHQLELVQSYWELAEIATVQIIPRMLAKRANHPLGQVCGPITTGGLGDRWLNLHRFHSTITALRRDGHHIFTQMPFEPALVRLAEADKKHGRVCQILEGFYLPLFRSGLIRQVFFMPDWATSAGASWERKLVAELGLEIIDLRPRHMPGHPGREPVSIAASS